MEPHRSALRRGLAREACLGLVPCLALVLACLARAPSNATAPADPVSRHDLPRLQRRWHCACDLSAIIDHPLLLAERAVGPDGS